MAKLKRNKSYSSYSLQHTAIHKFKLTLWAQGWTCKKSTWQTVSNKTQKMHKQTKQQNPPFKSTLSNERIFLSICSECPTFGWISWRFLCVCFFRVKFMFVYSNCWWFACLFLARQFKSKGNHAHPCMAQKKAAIPTMDHNCDVFSCKSRVETKQERISIKGNMMVQNTFDGLMKMKMQIKEHRSSE